MALDAQRLGKAMKAAIDSVGIDQESAADGALGEARMVALAQAIIDEFKESAEIGSLSTLEVVAGTPPHIHNTKTVISKGKIS